MKWISLLLLLCFQSFAFSDEGARLAELDQFWEKISETVREGDFKAYRAAHHPDGVLLANGQSSKMKLAHEGFKEGFDHTAAGEVDAGIEFRWTHRTGGSDTAWEKGVFRYWSKAGEIEHVQYTVLEVVLIKSDTGWQLMVQNQGKALTKEQWDALSDAGQETD